MNKNPETESLRLHANEQVTIASRRDILETLDENGTLNGLPLMPQMLEMAGSTHKVYKLAYKSCDTIDGSGGRLLPDAVHLEGVRCDGKAYGGCQAGCLIFWSEKWLRKSDVILDKNDSTSDETVVRGTRHANSTTDNPVYRCQATELLRASKPLSRYNLKQYWRDWRDNDVKLGSFVRAFSFFVFLKSLKIGAFNLQIKLFNKWQKLWGHSPYPFVSGKQDKTPVEILDLQPGELVRVKTHEEILATVNTGNRNRGLFFDAEMVPYCGHTFRVQEKVTRIVHEKTGAMIEFDTPGVILKGVFCRSKVSSGRLFCPRSIHHYWREIWLERLDTPGTEKQ